MGLILAFAVTTKSRFTGELRPFIRLWQWKMLDNVRKLLCVNYMVQKRPSLSADNFSKGVDQNNLHICVQDLWSDILFSQLLDPFFHYLSARRPVREPTRLSRRGHQAFWHPHSDQPWKKVRNRSMPLDPRPGRYHHLHHQDLPIHPRTSSYYSSSINYYTNNMSSWLISSPLVLTVHWSLGREY